MRRQILAKLFMSLILLLLGATAVLAQKSDHQIHVVQANETLFDIALHYFGDGYRFSDIVAATQTQHALDPTFANIQDANLIEVGDKLLIPMAHTATSKPTPAQSSTEFSRAKSTPVSTEPSGQIAFSFWNNAAERCTYEINVINVQACLADGETCQAERRIFKLNNASEPALSPDGSRLAFRGWGTIPDAYRGQAHPYKGCSAPSAAERWIQTASLDGTDLRQITGYWEDGHPDWSPDGQRLIFDTARNGDGITRIMVMAADTTGENGADQIPADLRIAGRYPSWAADNERFVYRGCDVSGNRCGLWLAQAFPVEAWDLGLNMLGPLLEGAELSHPDWSPVSEQIVYNAPVDGNWDIYAIAAAGGDPQRITTEPTVEGLPTWSPDGQWLAYLSDAGGNWGIWLMRPDGTERQQLFSYDGGQYTLPSETDPYGSRNWYDEQISWAR